MNHRLASAAFLGLVAASVLYAVRGGPDVSARSVGTSALTPVPFPIFYEPVADGGADPNRHVNGLLYNGTRSCMQVTGTDGGTDGGYWDCVAMRSQLYVPPDAGPTTQVQPASTPPTASAVGATYYDTTSGCLRTWNGTAYTACPTPSTQPTPPNTLLSPSASAPAGTYSAGTTYYNTTCKALLSHDGAAFAACPTTTAATAMAQSSNAPALPPGLASQNRGNVYFDTTSGCTRSTRNGLTWGPCLTTESCTTATVAAVAIPLLGATGQTTATIPGAIAGRACTVAPPTGQLITIGVTPQCSVTAANTPTFRFSGGVGLAIAGGTYTICTEVLW